MLDRSGGPAACWPAASPRTVDGYARINVGPATLLAHRVALSIKLGRPLLPGEVTRHLCHNRPCCNPAHLAPGTPADNSADMLAAGREPSGERSGSAKLTAAQVAEIRETARVMGRVNFEEMGRRYGVTGRQIAYIIRGSRWTRVAP